MISGQSAGLWLLADCNNFYASCERLFRPDLRNRPVVVLSNNDGCVIARSAEAKALNIAMGEAEFRIHGFLKEHGVAVFSSNFALYGDLSARVIQTLETLCQDVRQYSIDEAFCRLTGAEAANAAELASEARLRVERWTGIPVSIGISSTKTLAKLANHAAKKSGRGLWQVLPGEEDCTRLLRESPVEEVWGVGRRVAARLSAAGIRTAFD
ncbi:MAG: SOS mutagenesis and repair protein UmuC, partial [Desulfovibrio sp.]